MFIGATAWQASATSVQSPKTRNATSIWIILLFTFYLLFRDYYGCYIIYI